MNTRIWTRIRRALTVVGLSAVLASPAVAAPGTFAYVGELADAMGFVDDEVDVIVTLFDAATGGTQLWTQSWSGVDVIGGLFMVHVGQGSATPLGPALLGRSDVWMEVSVNAATLAPRQPISSVGYAQVARHAERLGGVGAADVLTHTALATTPSRAGTAESAPSDPAPGELWYDAQSRVLYTWDTDDQEWEAVTTGDLDPSNLPPNGMPVLSNGSLSNEFTNVSHLWAPQGGVPIEDATIAGPGTPAVAEVNVAEVPASYIYGVRVFTNFNLTSANHITMTLFPPAGTGVDPIVLRDGTLSFGTYGDAWDVDNTPALAALLGTNPTGPWTIAVVDNDNNLAAPTTAGSLNSFELRYDIVRGDNLVASGLFEAEDVIAEEILAGDVAPLTDVAMSGDVVIEGELARRIQAHTFTSIYNSSGNMSQRTMTFQKERDDTVVEITYNDSFGPWTTGNIYFEFRINGSTCRDADNNQLRYHYRIPNSTNGYKQRVNTFVCYCEQVSGIGDGTFLPAGQYTLQMWVSNTVYMFYNTGGVGSLSIEEIYLD